MTNVFFSVFCDWVAVTKLLWSEYSTEWNHVVKSSRRLSWNEGLRLSHWKWTIKNLDSKKLTGFAFVISSMILESCFKVEDGELDATTMPTGSGSGYKPFFLKNVAPIFIVNMKVCPESS